MARTVILGWGSLIWELGDLCKHVRGEWKSGGPVLPIEFSRISQSRHCALTLVIDPAHGVKVSTQFIESNRTDPDDAACDLRTREGTAIRHIGLIDIRSGFVRSKWPDVTNAIKSWAEQHGLEAVVWTDLSSNFAEKKRSSSL